MWKTYLAIGLVTALVCLLFLDRRYQTTHRPGGEMAAYRSLNTIITAQAVYRSEYDQFARSLAELGPPAEFSEGPTARAADLIPQKLASGETSGYRFLLLPHESGYRLLAFPLEEVFGERSFYSDETTIIRAHKGRPAWKTDEAIN